MGRLMAIDYGRRRCGVAVTDILQIAANPLETVPTGDLTDYVVRYAASEPLDAVIIGLPLDMKGNPSDSSRYIEPGITALRRRLPEWIQVIRWDERFTSVLAHKAMIDGGMKKMARRDKAVVDGISAAIILNSYLDSRH